MHLLQALDLELMGSVKMARSAEMDVKQHSKILRQAGLHAGVSNSI